MKITVDILRQAGVPDEMIVRICRLAELADTDHRRRVHTERQKRWRESKRETNTQAPAVDANRRLQASTSTLDPLWVLPESGVQFAIAHGWTAQRITVELIRFKDHAATKGRVAVDWLAAWRLWVTSPYQEANGWRNGNGKHRGSRDEWDAAFEQLAAAAGHEDQVHSGGGHPAAPVPPNARR